MIWGMMGEMILRISLGRINSEACVKCHHQRLSKMTDSNRISFGKMAKITFILWILKIMPHMKKRIDLMKK